MALELTFRSSMHRIFSTMLLTGLLVAQLACAGELVVIANPKSGIEHLSKDEVVNIFLGRNRNLSSGAIAMPIDLQISGSEREQFYRLLTNKTLPQINSYWAQLVFSGKATPPFQAPDARTALNLVATNPSAIAYVDRGAVDNRVKVVLELKP